MPDAARPKIDGMTTGDRLRKAREAKGLTQQALADMAKVSKQAISQIERNVTRRPEAATLEPICRKAGISLQWVMNGTGQMLNPSPGKSTTENYSYENVTSGSQLMSPDAVILHRAVSLLLFDLDHGGPRSANTASSILMDLYQRIAAGTFTDDDERAFEDAARSRGKKAGGVEDVRAGQSRSGKRR